MSELDETCVETVRLITFEIAGAFYGLPIADVLEVAEIAPICCVPTLPKRVGGIMNHHGDALPVVFPAALLPVDEPVPEPQHALVLSGRPDDESAGRLALLVDRVVGLTDAPRVAAGASEVVVGRQPIGGRLANILDTGRLIERAAGVIERSVGQSDTGLGGQ